MNLNGLLARVVAELTVSSGSRLEQMPPPPPPPRVIRLGI